MAEAGKTSNAEQTDVLTHNRRGLTALIAGRIPRNDIVAGQEGLSLILERFPIASKRQKPLVYDGERGMEGILRELAHTYQGGEVYVDGRLVGLAARIGFDGAPEPIDLSVSVGMGCQLRLEVGPSDRLQSLLDAIGVFDRHFYLACRAVGIDVELMAQGCNPLAASPSDIVVTPTKANALTNTYLSQTGRYARDAMRCTAATELRLPLRADEAGSVEDFRLCCLLAPLLAFGCDNSLTTCSADPQTTPTMLRSLLWSQVDPTRTGIAAGIFRDDFGYKAYERALEAIRPICFTTDEGITFSTGADSCADIMSQRRLSVPEATRLLDVPIFDVRWRGCLELRMVDSLPPRLAVAYAALVKGLLATAETRLETRKLLGAGFSSTDAIDEAWTALRTNGWGADVYGKRAARLIHELAGIAEKGLQLREERRMLETLSQLWDVSCTPRETLVLNWKRESGKDEEERAVELYGEGAVRPFYEEFEDDDFAGTPGETSQLPIITR